jgi:hypothetical protein
MRADARRGGAHDVRGRQQGPALVGGKVPLGEALDAPAAEHDRDA